MADFFENVITCNATPSPFFLTTSTVQRSSICTDRFVNMFVSVLPLLCSHVFAFTCLCCYCWWTYRKLQLTIWVNSVSRLLVVQRGGGTVRLSRPSSSPRSPKCLQSRVHTHISLSVKTPVSVVHLKLNDWTFVHDFSAMVSLFFTSTWGSRNEVKQFAISLILGTAMSSCYEAAYFW